MAGQDDPTARFYTQNAARYAASAYSATTQRLDMFLSRLSPAARILELGCGNGRDSAAMIARGFEVTPTDGTPDMAAQAQARLGVPVAVLRFDQLEAASAFDGIWAHACLLHVPRADLAGILLRIHRALRPGGHAYASFKAGEAEGHDELGRYFNYPSAPWLRSMFETVPWASLEMEEMHGGAWDGRPTDWLHVLASKPSVKPPE